MSEERPVKAILSWEFSGKHQWKLHDGDTVEAGRDLTNDIVLASAHISRRHAVFTCREDGVEVQDLGSVNGTDVNGVKVSGPCVLKDGDRIRLWEVILTFYVEQDTQPHAREEEEEEPDDTLFNESKAPQPRLVISAGPQEGRRILLTSARMVIGRETAGTNEWDIALQDRLISRPHAQIKATGDGFMLADMGSANATLLNGEEITQAMLLRDGDVIQMGETTLIFRAK